MKATLQWLTVWFLRAAAWCAVRSYERKAWSWLCDEAALWERAAPPREPEGG